MKAAVYYGPNDIRVEEKPVPQVGPDDILIKVEASSICGTDLRIFKSGHHAVKPPQIIGHENAGTVAKVGANVEKYKVGDRVAIDPIVSCGYCYYCRRGITNLCSTFKKTIEAFGYYYPGGFAEYMLVPGKAIARGNVIPVPEGMSFEEAAIAEPMACALNAQILARVGAGNSVLVIGAGPVGMMHAALSRILGATKVIISEVSENRLEMAKKAAISDYYINPEEKDLKSYLMEITDGIGPDVIMIAAPSKAAQEDSVQLIANQGRICFFGGLPKNDYTACLDSNLIHYKEIFIHGSSGATTEHIKMCIEFMGGKRIDGSKFISGTCSLEEIPEYLQQISEGKHLKVVVKP
ncbi:MAG: zinc-dependent dehydrogenase [Actinobacteria bacterium]|nr:zinc-dependent dehydrogenase [Actinomycetota bacterium]